MHTLIIGFDSFDPQTFERLSSEGKMPNLTRFVENGKYARFKVSDPPQTEVSWTSIATGQDPGGHGIFDFVHRDPSSYTPFVSILPTKRSAVGVQFVPPYQARTIFDEATGLGYPATSLWWPATFPARPESPVHTIPGLGTPDILGKLGVGILFTTEAGSLKSGHKTAVKVLNSTGKDRYSSQIDGPPVKKGKDIQPVSVDLKLERMNEDHFRLVVGGQTLDLKAGSWSDVLEIPFKMGLLFTVKAVTRVILTQISPEIRLYLLPLQIHPLASPWRYASPPGFVKQLWKVAGPYLSLGWPQDTTGLEEGCISDDQFLDLCKAIFAGRERALLHQIQGFDEGVLAVVFDDLDRVQHMFRRDRLDVVEEWYALLDGLVGRVEQTLSNQKRSSVKLMILSDHGFADFEYKVHLNRWLIDQGFLAASGNGGAGDFSDVRWSKSQAYALGLNSLYLNLVGREGQGIVPGDEAESLVDRIKLGLSGWKGPDGRLVFQRVLSRQEAFSGPLAGYGPDLVLGYTPGYRASPETGLGKWEADAIVMNQDHWGADHCVDSVSVPGVYFSSRGLEGLSEPSFRDIPRLTIGKDLVQSKEPPPPPTTAGGEDQKILEERLKGLGYL
jgi:predicted AlkP superfamily phosphohydrolase/phosphomutase